MLTSEVEIDVKAHYMKIILDGTQQNQEEIKEEVRRLQGGSTVH
jgi:hypothetical protein